MPRKKQPPSVFQGVAPDPPQVSPVATLLREARLKAFLGGTEPRAVIPGEVTADVQRLIEQTARVYVAAVSESTRADYVRRWHHFETWCGQRHFVALPADPATVMGF